MNCLAVIGIIFREMWRDIAWVLSQKTKSIRVRFYLYTIVYRYGFFIRYNKSILLQNIETQTSLSVFFFRRTAMHHSFIVSVLVLTVSIILFATPANAHHCGPPSQGLPSTREGASYSHYPSSFAQCFNGCNSDSTCGIYAYNANEQTCYFWRPSNAVSVTGTPGWVMGVCK